MLWAFLRFGSITAGLAYIGGDRLMADATTKSVGEIEPGAETSVGFELTNLTERPVTFYGYKSTSPIVRIDQLPFKIPAKTKRVLSVGVKAQPDLRIGDFAAMMTLYSDYPRKPKMPLMVVGRIDRLSSGPARPAFDASSKRE